MILTTFSAQAGLSRLEALSMIETGDNDAAIGQAGEVSRYQIKPWIWHQYNSSASYRNRGTSKNVAEKHLAVLQTTFRRQTRREPTDFDLYVLWNAGPTYYARLGFRRTRVHQVIRERAQRYANLCHNTSQTLAKVTPQKPTPPGPTTRQQIVSQPVPSKSLAKAGLPWPVFSELPGSSLQNPMFPVLPLVSRPVASGTAQQPIFAIGGVQAD